MRIATGLGVFLFALAASTAVPAYALEECQTTSWRLQVELMDGGGMALRAQPLTISSATTQALPQDTFTTGMVPMSTETPAPIEPPSLPELITATNTDTSTPVITESSVVTESGVQDNSPPPTTLPTIDETPVTNTTANESAPIVVETAPIPPTPPPAPTIITAVPTNGIRINELVSDPITGAKEWVELYNAQTLPVSLAGWSLLDGSKKATPLQGTVAPGDFFVITAPLGALNNDGDLVELKDGAGMLVDEISYGNWSVRGRDGHGAAISDPYGLGRVPTGVGALVETIPTPGSANIARNPTVASTTNATIVNTVSATTLAAATMSNSTLIPIEYALPLDTPSATLAPTNQFLDQVAAPGTQTAAPVSLTRTQTNPIGTPALRALTPNSPFAFLGVLASIPGLMSGNRFYITQGDSAALFASNKPLPALPIGTPLLLAGTKTAARSYDGIVNAWKTAGDNLEPVPEPMDAALEELLNIARGLPVRVQGTVASVAAHSFTLANTQTSLRVALSPLMQVTPKKGMGATVAGYVEQEKGGLVLYPLSQQAIALVAPKQTSPIARVKGHTATAKKTAKTAKATATSKAKEHVAKNTADATTVVAVDSQRSASLKWSITSASLAAMVTAALKYFARQPLAVGVA